MGELVGARKQFYDEDVNARVSVSQALAKKLAQGQQFIHDNQLMRLTFGAVGSYYVASPPLNGVGTIEIIERDSEIVNVWVINHTSGTAGTTEVDIKKAALGSSVYASIFSTTPKFASTSADNDVIDSASVIAAAPTGVTRPVLSSNELDAGDKLRFDLITTMTGGASVYVIIHIRPR